jgi:hypothetical protein
LAFEDATRKQEEAQKAMIDAKEAMIDAKEAFEQARTKAAVDEQEAGRKADAMLRRISITPTAVSAGAVNVAAVNVAAVAGRGEEEGRQEMASEVEKGEGGGEDEGKREGEGEDRGEGEGEGERSLVQQAAAMVLTEFFQGIVARAQGLQYRIEFPLGQIMGLVIGRCIVEEVMEDSVAEEEGAQEGSTVIKCNGCKVANDVDLAMMMQLAKQRKRSIMLTFTPPGVQEWSEKEQDAAVIITNCIREVCDQKQGMEYTCTFAGVGKKGMKGLGFEMRNLTVSRVLPMGGAASMGVVEGSTIKRFANRKMINDMCFVMAVKVSRFQVSKVAPSL